MMDIRVVVLADPNGRHFEDDMDPGDVVFDEQGTPILEYGHHAVHGMGWTLWTVDDEEYFIPGRLDDVEAVTREAREWLRRQAES
jgi:hypothetical protein